MTPLLIRSPARLNRILQINIVFEFTTYLFRSYRVSIRKPLYVAIRPVYVQEVRLKDIKLLFLNVKFQIMRIIFSLKYFHYLSVQI